MSEESRADTYKTEEQIKEANRQQEEKRKQELAEHQLRVEKEMRLHQRQQRETVAHIAAGMATDILRAYVKLPEKSDGNFKLSSLANDWALVYRRMFDEIYESIDSEQEESTS